MLDGVDGDLSGTAVTFSVGYDDDYGMELWCSACLAAGLHEKADLLYEEPQRYGTEFPLERLNRLAAEHLRAVHG
jgi:hypothetical protein